MPKFNGTVTIGHILSFISITITLAGVAFGAISAWTEIRYGLAQVKSEIVGLKEETAHKYDSIREIQGDTAADISRLAARTRSIETTVATRGGQFEALQEDVRDTNQLLRDLVMRRSELMR